MSNQTPDNSIYNNITEICKNVFMQTSGTRPPENVLKHLRSKCYEILLKKSCYKYPDPPDINMSLLKKCFIMKSDMQTICDMDRSNRLEKCTHKIMNEKIYKEEVFEKILSLLVCLADSLQYMEPLNLVPWTFGKRDEFCLIKSRADVGDSSLYPMYNIGMFSLNDDLDKEYYKDPFRRLQEAECRGQSVNPYFPHFGTELLKLEPGSGLPLLGQFLPQTKNSLLSSSKLNSSYSGQFFDLNKNIIANDESMDCLCIQEKISNSGSSSDHHVTFCTSNEGIVVEPASSGQITSKGSFRSGTGSGVSIRTLTDQEDDALELWSKLEVSDRANKHRNWSHLGDVNPPKEPEFATEVDSALLFWTISNPTMNYINLDTSDFIRDVKHLLAGISSRTFLYNNNIDSFELIENVALPQKSPSCAEGYSESFICAGNWIMRLTKMFGGYKENKGFVYEALRKIVCDYLFSYQQIIFNISCTSVIELFQETLDLRTQIEILGHLFTEFEKDFPQGSQLLTMILSKTNDVVNRDVELILFAIIRECCTVYFRIIQQWLFTGILYDPYCELFIVKHDVSGGSRLHWNTCYTIVDKDTPAFLKSISSEILNCGKNLQLLRDCDPTHPLVTSLPEIAPYIPCCMSLEDVAELNNVCNKYNDKAVKMCGKLITIQVHLENEKLKRVENIAIAQRKRIENYEKWKDADLRLKQISKEKKDQQAKILKQQIMESNTIRENERREKVREELILNKRDKILMEQQKQKIEEEKSKIKEYYDELGSIVQAKAIKTQWKNKRRINDEKRVNFLINERENDLKLLMSLSESHNQQTHSIINSEDKIDKQVAIDNLNDIPRDVEERNVNDTNATNLNTIIKNIEIKISHMDMDANEELLTNADEHNDFYLNLNKKDSSESDTDFSSTLATPVSDINILEDNLNENVETELDNAQTFSNVDNKIDNVCKTDKFNNLVEDFQSAKRNKLKVLGTSEQIDNFCYFNTNNIDNLSQSEKNKRHNLGHHYNQETEDKIPIVKTQAQINKERYMATEFGINESTRETKSLTLNLNAEGLRNREKMFFSSLDYLSNNYDKLSEGSMKTSRSVGHMSVDSTPITPQSTKDTFELPEKELINTADIIDIIQKHNDDIATADIDLIDGFKFPTCDDYLLKEKESSHEVSNLIVPRFGMDSPFKNCLVSLNNKQLCIFGGERDEDQLDSTTIEGLSIGNITSFLHKSVQIPLLAQCDLVRDAVMHYFISEVDILGHFYSLRRFLLLLDGEFGSALCGEIFAKMESGLMPAHVLSPSVLHDILNRALIVCGGVSDPNAERLSFCLQETPPTHWEHSSADALKCLLPSYKAPWPLSMILPQSILDQYALIFQHLMKVRRIAFKLEECFESMNSALRSCGQDLLRSTQFRSVQLWRGIMSHFVRSWQVYQTGSVLYSATWKFEKLLQDVKGADELYRRHKQYVKHISFLSFQSASSNKIRKVFDNCFTTILLFNRTLHAGGWIPRTNKPEFKHSRFKDLEKIFINFEDIAAHCYKFCLKLSICGYQPMLAEFVDLLDMNGYYTKLMGKYTRSNVVLL